MASIHTLAVLQGASAPLVVPLTTATSTTNDLNMSTPTAAGGSITWTGQNYIGELGNITTLAMVSSVAWLGLDF